MGFIVYKYDNKNQQYVYAIVILKHQWHSFEQKAN